MEGTIDNHERFDQGLNQRKYITHKLPAAAVCSSTSDCILVMFEQPNDIGIMLDYFSSCIMPGRFYRLVIIYYISSFCRLKQTLAETFLCSCGSFPFRRAA